LRAAEENARRRKAYDEAEAGRDRLAEELRQVYPEIERTLGDLIARLHASEARLAVVNGAASTNTACAALDLERYRSMSSFELIDMMILSDDVVDHSSSKRVLTERLVNADIDDIFELLAESVAADRWCLTNKR
jgi:hypothetical protein